MPPYSLLAVVHNVRIFEAFFFSRNELLSSDRISETGFSQFLPQVRAVGIVGAGETLTPPPPNFGRSVNPISTRGRQIRPSTFKTHPPQIFRPSYGPELGVGSKAIITIIMRPKIIDNTLLSVCYCCLLELDILFEQKLVRIRFIPEKKLHI